MPDLDFGLERSAATVETTIMYYEELIGFMLANFTKM